MCKKAGKTMGCAQVMGLAQNKLPPNLNGLLSRGPDPATDRATHPPLGVSAARIARSGPQQQADPHMKMRNGSNMNGS